MEAERREVDERVNEGDDGKDEGPITPVFKKFYDAAKSVENVTVVKIEEMATLLGITFPKEE